MIQRHIQCDLCNQSFWQSVEKRSAPLPSPDQCPYCHGTGQHTEETLKWISKEKREVNKQVQQWAEEGRAPGYNSHARAQLQSEERTFRAMEAGSQIRAEAAASELGVSVSEVSNLKITDMKDNPKQGEISAKIPLSQDGLAMQAKARQMSFSPGSNAAAFAGQGTVINGSRVGTMVGPGAGHIGSGVLSGLQQNHAAREAVIKTRGH